MNKQMKSLGSNFKRMLVAGLVLTATAAACLPALAYGDSEHREYIFYVGPKKWPYRVVMDMIWFPSQAGTLSGYLQDQHGKRHSFRECDSATTDMIASSGAGPGIECSFFFRDLHGGLTFFMREGQTNWELH
ncbi:MAG: hypothetical protein ACAI44_07515, partial [Candidatus Sericytochromatia bacterium]